MKSGMGKAVCEGIAIGTALVYQRAGVQLCSGYEGPLRERELLHTACEAARIQLTQLYDKALCELGHEQAQILEVQRTMLDDLYFLEQVYLRIDSGLSASCAVYEAGAAFRKMFAAMEDAYLKAREADVQDMTVRLLRVLSGEQQTELIIDEPVILVAEDLTPSETVQLPQNKILALVTQAGSAHSHTAILARTMNIPALVQADLMPEPALNGTMMIVDGINGRYWLEPGTDLLHEMQMRHRQWVQAGQNLQAYRGRPSITRQGKTVRLYANIGKPDELELALRGDAEGIGLMRSEFLYLGRDSLPTENELFAAYQTVVQGLSGKPLVIRTLDIGADKRADYLQLPAEENPALGYRGIRICLTRPEVFRPQLRAVYRAAALGPVSVMFPMIASVDEVRQIKRICCEIAAELKCEGAAFAEPALGIMIETPAAALMSRELAKEVQFFSVGTNDLTQYTLAVDRQNTRLENLFDTRHPAVLALLKMIVENAHAQGIWAGICGELGADTDMTQTLLQMGYDELSVSPGRVLAVRRAICKSDA